MPSKKRMRYYPAVGPAIPRTQAGRSRVTHPFAGCVLLRPHDLHVLSTPPAFVLSQDQTLQEFDIARSSNRCHHAVAHDSVSESLNCSVQALPDVQNGRQFNELASHIQIPIRLSKSSLSL